MNANFHNNILPSNACNASTNFASILKILLSMFVNEL